MKAIEKHLKKISEAPKDGTWIIIVYNTPNNDLFNWNIRRAKWWKPTELSQWERGARPHWEYISDNEFCSTIHEDAIVGWI